MGAEQILKLLKLFITKEVVKKLAGPIVDEIFAALAEMAKKSETNLDDVTVAALKQAVKDALAQW